MRIGLTPVSEPLGRVRRLFRVPDPLALRSLVGRACLKKLDPVLQAILCEDEDNGFEF